MEKGVKIRLCVRPPSDLNLLYAIQKAFGVDTVGKQNQAVYQKDLKVFWHPFDTFPPGGIKSFQFGLV